MIILDPSDHITNSHVFHVEQFQLPAQSQEIIQNTNTFFFLTYIQHVMG